MIVDIWWFLGRIIGCFIFVGIFDWCSWLLICKILLFKNGFKFLIWFLWFIWEFFDVRVLIFVLNFCCWINFSIDFFVFLRFWCDRIFLLYDFCNIGLELSFFMFICFNNFFCIFRIYVIVCFNKYYEE